MNPDDSSRDPAIMSPDEERESRYVELLLEKDIRRERGRLTVVKEEEHVVKAKTPIQ